MTTTATTDLNRALLNIAAAWLRTHCSDPTLSPSCGYSITQGNGAKRSNSADTAPSSVNAGRQQTPAANAGTSGPAVTTPAADHAFSE